MATAFELRTKALEYMRKNPGNPGVCGIIKELESGIQEQANKGKFFYSQEYEELSLDEIGVILNHFKVQGFRTEYEKVFQDETVECYMLTIIC